MFHPPLVASWPVLERLQVLLVWESWRESWMTVSLSLLLGFSSSSSPVLASLPQKERTLGVLDLVDIVFSNIHATTSDTAKATKYKTIINDKG